MMQRRGKSVPSWSFLTVGLLLALGSRLPAAEREQVAPAALTKIVPESVRDLQDIQAHVQRLVDRVLPYTVALRVGAAQGSGVLIDADGHILTAGHVSGEPGRRVEVILHNGRKLRGITLGANAGIDSGLVRITDAVKLPYAPKARSADLRRGQWCLALGHPGGFQAGRAPVVRLGRVLDANPKYVRTDCALVGGDSGGPLFDMDGRVIGVNSRIGASLAANIHVPVDTYDDTWDRLAASEFWGSDHGLFNFARPGSAYLGVEADPDARPLRVLAVTPESPAARAGVQVDDVLLKLDQNRLSSFEDLGALIRNLRPGAEITLHLRRGDQTRALTVVLGQRPD